jgi:hypothetical protein
MREMKRNLLGEFLSSILWKSRLKAVDELVHLLSQVLQSELLLCSGAKIQLLCTFRLTKSKI